MDSNRQRIESSWPQGRSRRNAWRGLLWLVIPGCAGLGAAKPTYTPPKPNLYRPSPPLARPVAKGKATESDGRRDLVRWFLKGGLTPTFSRQLEAGTLWSNQHGARWVEPSDSDLPIEWATELIHQDAIGGLALSDQRFLFVHRDASLTITAGPLGDTEQRQVAPKELTSASVGGSTPVAVDGEGQLCRLDLTSFGWECRLFNGRDRARAVVLDQTGRGLITTQRNHLYHTDDDGRTWLRLQWEGGPFGLLHTVGNSPLRVSEASSSQWFAYQGDGRLVRLSQDQLGAESRPRLLFALNQRVKDGIHYELFPHHIDDADFTNGLEWVRMELRWRRLLAPRGRHPWNFGPWETVPLFDWHPRLLPALLDSPQGAQVLAHDTSADEATLYRVTPSNGPLQPTQAENRPLLSVLTLANPTDFELDAMAYLHHPLAEAERRLLPSPKVWFRRQDSAGWLTVNWGEGPGGDDEVVRCDNHLRILRRFAMPLDPDDPTQRMRNFVGLDSKDHLVVRGRQRLWVIDDEGRASKLALPFVPLSLAFSGRRGLALVDGSGLLETADYGRTWVAVENPGWLRELVWNGLRMSCSAEGCNTPWGYRLGWRLR